MIEDLNALYQLMLVKFDKGLSNTSTVKFDDIKSLFSNQFGIPIEEIYATGAGTRPGNLEVRLSQGLQATRHTTLGLAFLVDNLNTEANRKRLTNSTFTTVLKFLGRGKSKYDNILILVYSEERLFITGLISSFENKLSDSLKNAFEIEDVRYSYDKDDENLIIGYNKIYFGAPGTGKSYIVDSILSDIPDERKERITFHPEYDNVSFVGGYRPISEVDKNGELIIKYQFVAQVFTKIYVNAWNDLSNSYYLAIEEINRGNCAEIFGDIFQLLDRNSNYSISPSQELSKYLLVALTGDGLQGIKGGKLALPPNLVILATMNTSDQSLFPMDSAFKRRWSWEYVPINYEQTNEDGTINSSFNYQVALDSKRTFKWIDLINRVNLEIKSNPNLGMDKRIGNYFIKSDDSIIMFDEFVYKVMFYLWNDVFKDEDNIVFPIGKTYEDFFPLNTNGVNNMELILKNLNIDILDSI